jgi:hypothetical protein
MRSLADARALRGPSACKASGLHPQHYPSQVNIIKETNKFLFFLAILGGAVTIGLVVVPSGHYKMVVLMQGPDFGFRKENPFPVWVLGSCA